jgi:hypothetical protein
MNAFDDPNALPLRVASEALHILEHTKQTDYQHNLVIDDATGTYDVDCSGFVSYILERVAPAHLKLIPLKPSESRLGAGNYCNFFASLPVQAGSGWRQVPRLLNARRGDLIAWGPVNKVPHSGHVFIVAKHPVTNHDGSLSVMAYDSSHTPHFDDSRGNGPGQFPNGIGSGAIHFQTGSGGEPVAFQSNASEKFASVPIAIGRIEFFAS